MPQPAIIPFSGEIPQQAKLVGIEQNSLYPDPGTVYKGFYKYKTGDGTWQLRRQTPFFKEHGFSTADGILQAGPCFVTTILVTWGAITGTGANGDGWEYHDSSQSTSNLRFAGRIFDGDGQFSVTFPTPLQFPNGLFLQNSLTPAGGGVSLKIFGWVEETGSA